MGLNSILKTILKNLKFCYIFFFSFWVIIGIGLLFPISENHVIYEGIYLIFGIFIILFNLIIGSLIYGSYGKTFISIQNNRKNYVLSSLIIWLCSSLLLTLLFMFLRIKAQPGFNNDFNIELITLILLIYLCCFGFGSLYGLYVKYNKITKRVLYVTLFTCIIISCYFVSFKSLKLVNVILNYINTESSFTYIIIFGCIDILSLLICSFKYLKLNILKAYSDVL